MKTTVKTMFGFIILFVCSSIISAQNSQPWGNLSAGKYDVGFKLIEKLDNSRTIDSNNTPRPVQISLWYPAVKGNSAERMTYKDYVETAAHEKDFSKSTPEDLKTFLDNYGKFLTYRGIPEKVFQNWMNLKMNAVENAEPADGKFPLILLAQGNMQSPNNLSVLSEYLASHGFVVATSPSQGRITGPMTDTSQTYSQVLDQATDMRFIFETIKNEKYINMNDVGVIGYSFGGRSSFLYLNNFPGAKAYISLDGGLGNQIGMSWVKEVDIKTDKINMPILHFYEDVEQYIVPDFEVFDKLVNSDRYFMKVDSMHHSFFWNLGMVIGTVDGFVFPGADPESTQQKTEAVYEYTLYFLNNYLKENTNEMWNKAVMNKDSLPDFMHLKVVKKGM